MEAKHPAQALHASHATPSCMRQLHARYSACDQCCSVHAAMPSLAFDTLRCWGGLSSHNNNECHCNQQQMVTDGALSD